MLVVDNCENNTFMERAQKIQQQFWRDVEHRHFSGVKVLRELSRIETSGAVSMPVIFTSNIVYGDMEESTAESSELNNLVYTVTQTPQVWLDHQITEQGNALVLDWDALDDLFPQGMLDDMFNAYHLLLTRLAASDEAWQTESFDLLPDSQLAMRKKANATDILAPTQLLHTLFLDQVEQIPDKLALVTTEKRMSYRELALRTRQIGQELQTRGIQPNQLVAVVMDKGWEQVPAVIGVMYSSAAYLPIDPAVPKERLWHLLKDGQVRYVLTQSRLEGELEWPEGVQILCVDTMLLPQKEDVPELNPVQTCDDLAYVIHTSGSTGLPKGVMIDHKGAVNTILDINRRFHVTSEDTLFALSNLNFDLSVYDIFGPLAAGGTIVMPDNPSIKDPDHWLKLIKQEKVTLWNSVPALMQMLIEAASGKDQSESGALRLVMLSGDWIPLDLPDRIRAVYPESEIISLGGATEASIWSIFYPINRVEPGWKSIPYGQPMANQKFHVLNKKMGLSPDWVSGDLYISGMGLARGYWRDDQKTKKSFIRHPESGMPLYRTGDMGRFLPDGNIEFLGREDQQVKLNGYRIELGEIETVLEDLSGVQNALVTALVTGDGKRQLVGYVVPKTQFKETGGSDDASPFADRPSE
jgi:amino acid adenylation domain-containing protein